MTPSARRALTVIRQCVEEERFIITTHFAHRMDERGMVWPDIVAAIENTKDVRSDGLDEAGRAKWLVTGKAADGLDVEFVCALDDEGEYTTVFITLYWN